jgi:MFS superfamily sulfate permease-like transporter
MRPGKRRADYNRELIAQGVGNVTCGMLGALPMTGVIVRSAANVRAGARTRASAIMHGIWLLGLVALLPGALGLIPTASLGGLLIVIGLRLVSLRVLRALAHQGFLSVACYGATVLAILLTNLLTGVATGVVLALCARMIPRLAREAG